MTYRADIFRSDTLISAEELHSRMALGQPLTILDVRWRPDRPDGRAEYELGHIEGAVYVDLEAELADRSIPGQGRYPLPSGTLVQAAARRWGVRNGVPIIVYDNWNRAGSARAWWILRAAGAPEVRVLDGGLTAWASAGHGITAGLERPDPGDIDLTSHDLRRGELPTLTEISEIPAAGVLIDARGRYDKHLESLGHHIPGARHIPGRALLDAHGFLRPVSELEELFARAGVYQAPVVGVCCGSGVMATVCIAALTILGINAALIPGSWRQSDAAASNSAAPDRIAAPAS
ncbi:sulfurtransferase [Nocardia miyunensis]|uniref:sulfurtransferase n=1 Tax=Nocardia miyunensis TaxID=282684 RepID=UPI000A75816B|nr:rhodanese-like domain-containing protein [Nocardia miyunensis]